MANKHDALVDLLEAVQNTDYSFTTITPLSHQRVNARPGNQWAKNSEASLATNPTYFGHRILRDVFGWSRAFYEMDIDPEIFALMQKAGVLKSYEDGWLSTVRISTFQDENFGKQFFMHSAYPTTEAEAVFFGPDTYRYLHEINMVMCQGHQVKHAVDIGCGAGPAAILTALHHPNANVYAVDINQAALELTSVNATVANTKNVMPLYSDLLSGVDGNFDLITANPPYLVDKEQRTYRHGGEDLGSGLSYDIVESSLPRVSSGGSFMLYTGVAINDGVDNFKNKVVDYLQSFSKHQSLLWSYREIDPDVFGEELGDPCYAETDRIAAIVLKITRK